MKLWKRGPKIHYDHWCFVITGLIIPVVGSAVTYTMSIPIGMVLWAISFSGLITKCDDVQFGNGRKFHWMRQTVLTIGMVASLVFGALAVKKMMH